MGKKSKVARLPIKRVLQNRTAISGVGATIFSISFGLLDIGLSMFGIINPSIGCAIAGLAVLGMMAGAFLFIKGRSSVYRELLINEKGHEIKNIPDTLTAMFQRIRGIRTEQARKSMDIQTAKRIQAKMEDINPMPWWALRIIHYLQKAKEPKLFEQTVNTFHMIFVGSAYNKRYENFLCNIGGVLETEGFGLRQVITNDSEYKPLSEKLERQYAGVPQKIRKPILRYENCLYGFSSTILWDDYRKAHIGRLLPSTVEAKITRYSQLEKEVMSKLEEDVSKAIDRYMR